MNEMNEISYHPKNWHDWSFKGLGKLLKSPHPDVLKKSFSIKHASILKYINYYIDRAVLYTNKKPEWILNWEETRFLSTLTFGYTNPPWSVGGYPLKVAECKDPVEWVLKSPITNAASVMTLPDEKGRVKIWCHKQSYMAHWFTDNEVEYGDGINRETLDQWDYDTFAKYLQVRSNLGEGPPREASCDILKAIIQNEKKKNDENRDEDIW